MSRAKHDRAVICFDMNMSTNAKEQALHTLRFLQLLKISSHGGKSDTVAIHFLNAEGIPNANIFLEQTTYKEIDFDLLQDIVLGKDSIADTSKWFLSLRHAADELEQFSTERNVYTLQLILMTDLNLSSDCVESCEVDEFIATLNAHDIFFYVLGPDVVMPEMMKQKKDIQEWARNHKFKSDKDSNATRAMFQRIFQAVNGFMCKPKDGIELMEDFKYSKERQDWKCPLQIGPLKIKSVAVRILETTKMLQLKPVATRPVAMWKSAESDSTVELDRSDITSIIIVDKKTMSYPDDVWKNHIQYQGPRLFQCIGFVKTGSVPAMYLHCDEAHIVNMPNDDESQALRLLAQTCYDLSYSMMVLRAYNARNRPKLYLMTPRLKDLSFVFYMQPVPHSYNISRPYKSQAASIPKCETGDNVDAAKAFLNVHRRQLKSPLHPTLSVGTWRRQMLEKIASYINTKQIPSSEKASEHNFASDDIEYEKAQAILKSFMTKKERDTEA